MIRLCLLRLLLLVMLLLVMLLLVLLLLILPLRRPAAGELPAAFARLRVDVVPVSVLVIPFGSPWIRRLRRALLLVLLLAAVHFICRVVDSNDICPALKLRVCSEECRTNLRVPRLLKLDEAGSGFLAVRGL